MDSISILLNKMPCVPWGKSQKVRRKQRRALILFLEILQLYLHSGFDLSYAWPEALKELKGLKSDNPSLFASNASARSLSLVQAISDPQSENLGGILKNLSKSYPETAHRIWFGVLSDLYLNGAGVLEAVSAVAHTLRQEHQRELEAHFRSLPTRINVCLILFFLPATMALLFVPLVIEIIGNLK